MLAALRTDFAPFFRRNWIWPVLALSLCLKAELVIGISLAKFSSAPVLASWAHYLQNLLSHVAFSIGTATLVLLFPGRKRLVAALVLDFLVSFVMLVDVWNYRAFDAYSSLYQLQVVGNLTNIWDSVRSMMRLLDLVFLLDLPLLWWLGRGAVSYRAATTSVVGFLAAAAVCAGIVTLDHYRADVWGGGLHRILFRICWVPVQTMGNLSPVGYHLFDFHQFMTERKRLELSEAQRAEVEGWFDEKEPVVAGPLHGKFKDFNLIVIQVESLETFPIGQRIEGQEITPRINGLLQNSIFIPDIHEQVNVGTSSDSDLMINTSIMPVRSGSTFFRFPDNTYRSLPKLLEARRYSTTAIHPDSGAFWNWMPGLQGVGFQKCVDRNSFIADEELGLGISDGTYLRQIRPMIRAAKKPSYTFLVTLTSHGPFPLPLKYRELKLSKSLDDTTLGGYFQCLRYTDRQIGAFLDGLKEDGLLDNTVVVIEGDHGGMHKFYREELDAVRPQESWWQDEHSRIPLIIYSPALEGRRLDVKGGQVDIMPTICDLMGIEPAAYARSAMGRNLLTTKEDFAVLVNGAFVGKTKSREAHAHNSLEIADLIVRSNYFGK